MTTAAQLAEIRDPWDRLRASTPTAGIEQRPSWLTVEAAVGEDVFAVGLFDGTELVALAPFVLRRWPFQCKLGYRTLLSFPMRVARLCGNSFLAPADNEIQEALLRAIAQADVPYHAVFIEGMPEDEVLAGLVRDSQVVREKFWTYAPGGALRQWLLKLPPTFAEYDATLGGNHRWKFRRSAKKLEAALGSPLTLERITRLEDLPRFLEEANKLAAVSWQGRKLGSTVAVTADQVRKIEERTGQGWLRCYLLRGGGQAIAFVVGFQDSGTYIYSQPGYDPKWADYSPGNVCLYRIVQDLFEYDRPEWLDFDFGDNQYKAVFSTQSRAVQNVYLMRRSPYTGVALLTHRMFSATSSAVRAGLDRYGLREKVRHLLRRGGAPPK